MLDIEAVLGDVVLGHPQCKRYIATEDDGVVLAVSPDLDILECGQLCLDGDLVTDYMFRIVVAHQKKKNCRTQHQCRVDLRYRLPAPRHQDQWCHDLGKSSACIPSTEYTHGHPLLLLGKPARHIRDTHREGTACQANEEARHQELPQLSGFGYEIDGDNRGDHQYEHHHASAEFVCPHAKRQADE